MDLRAVRIRLTATASLLALGAGAAWAQSGESVPVWQPDPAWTIDITGYDLTTEFGGDPAFGTISGPVTVQDNSAIALELPELDGEGWRVSVRRQVDGGWFSGLAYTGFFTDEETAIGSVSSDTDRVHASLLDRTFADTIPLNSDFDDGDIDFASESISMDQQFGDLVLGRGFGGGALRGFWQGGLRIANSNVDRDVLYRNLEGASIDSAAITFRSDMWGVGPTVGGGVSLPVWQGGALSTSASASALYSHFDLSREDVYTDQSAGRTESRAVTLETSGVVPVFDASVELSQQVGAFHVGVGYTASAWLGGSRSLVTLGWDDVHDETSGYTVRSDDLITHGVFLRGGVRFGGVEGDASQDASVLWQDTIIEVTGYDLVTDFGGDPTFGTISGTLDPATDRFTIAQELPELDGDGWRVSVRRQIDGRWFSGLAYTGFFTDEDTAIGSAAADTDSVHASLLDKMLADESSLNGGFGDDSIVDFASESISMDQQFGDLVLGQGFGGGALSGFWQGGLRIANTEVDRDVLYQNLEGANDLDSAAITFRSDMRGVGPTVGGGVSLPVWPGATLSTSASASALYSHFDLSRQDVYTNQSVPQNESRTVTLESSGVVPVFDASVELSQQVGAFHVGVGYTASAWLGGARSLVTPGWDDTDDDTSVYTVREDDLITHGVFLKGGVRFGGAEGDASEDASVLWQDTIIEVTGYDLTTEFGGDSAFGTISGTLDPATDNFTVAQELPELDGDGWRVSVRRQIDAEWFSGLAYTGFFTDETSATGSVSSDTDRVHASLLDRSFADDAGLNDVFDHGRVDFASESISMDQQFGDLVLGQGFGGGAWHGFWQGGLRIANSDVDRDVLYRNLEGANDVDSAAITFRSDMWGVGPTVGGGVSLPVWQGGTLSTSASASALYSHFDLSREDVYTNQSTGQTESRGATLETSGVVPVFDASVELSQQFGAFYAGIGYTASAWLGGARSLAIPGWDDVDAVTSNYTVREDDLITHGVFIRGGILFGGEPG